MTTNKLPMQKGVIANKSIQDCTNPFDNCMYKMLSIFVKKKSKSWLKTNAGKLSCSYVPLQICDFFFLQQLYINILSLQVYEANIH